MPAFGQQLRSLMDANAAMTGKKWLLTAAPQCPFPDQADNPMLAGTVFFDIVWIQFYNNFCGIQSFTAGTSTQNNFNFATWDNWAKTVSLNKNVKLMLGIPGNVGAGAGYQTPSVLGPIISYCKSFSSFAGVMIWDMTQTWANTGFLDGISSDLGLPPSSQPPPPTPTTLQTVTVMPTSPVSTGPAGGGTVQQWGQCGGEGYAGDTRCVSPFSCVCLSIWWCQCE
jgi:chitinase